MRIVQKFGGTSVADLDRIAHVAQRIKNTLQQGHEVAVVVSAMAGETNRLVELCRAVSPMHDAREYDSIVAAGEQVSSGLLALSLQKIGVTARSWLGWQIPIETNRLHGKARITRIESAELRRRMAQGEVPVIAGFQGLADDHRITTLGRGGSDTSAVAMAAALQADQCDIYTDVEGVYTCDPRIVKTARKLDKISFEEMLELASLGAKVLETRSVEAAMKHNIRLQVLSSFSENSGTLVVNEDEIVEKQIVSGITYHRNEAKITLLDVPDRPGVAAGIFGPLAEAGINVDMIVQNISEDNQKTDMTFTIPRNDALPAKALLEKLQPKLEYRHLRLDEKLVKISVVGVGMRSHSGVAQKMFHTLAENGINIEVISTSEIKISVLIAEKYLELALRSLHSAYGLDGG